MSIITLTITNNRFTSIYTYSTWSHTTGLTHVRNLIRFMWFIVFWSSFSLDLCFMPQLQYIYSIELTKFLKHWTRVAIRIQPTAIVYSVYSSRLNIIMLHEKKDINKQDQLKFSKLWIKLSQQWIDHKWIQPICVQGFR